MNFLALAQGINEMEPSEPSELRKKRWKSRETAIAIVFRTEYQKGEHCREKTKELCGRVLLSINWVLISTYVWVNYPGQGKDIERKNWRDELLTYTQGQEECCFMENLLVDRTFGSQLVGKREHWIQWTLSRVNLP